jgi:peptidoglycan/LPS O-acetylase OafA/YrhL
MRHDLHATSTAVRRYWFGNLTAGWLPFRIRQERAPAATLGEKLRQREHNQNGFDTIRLIAAALVLVSHSFPISMGSNAEEPLSVLTRGQSTLGGLSVAAFFFISGLLISNSFEVSSTLSSFVRKRALRIMPGLLVVCLLLACIVGPLLTTLPLGHYYAGAWHFMKNAIFVPATFALPGVFADHPLPAINGSLWSLKFEVACYAVAAVILALKRGRLALVVLLWMSSFFVSSWLADGEGQRGAYFYLGLIAALYRFFGAGMVFYLLRDRLSLRTDLAWLALIFTLLSTLTPFFMEVSATCGVYALLVFGYECPHWFRKITARGDISYGTYVYAYPTQQIMYAIVGPHPWLITATALPLTFAAAILSWIFVERPALRMKQVGRRRGPNTKPGEKRGNSGTTKASKLPTW